MEPPSFVSSGLHSIRAAPGSDASLVFPQPSGTPPFHFEWSRAGASLDDRFTTSDDAGGVRLTVSTARTGDSGVYTLQASNAAGRDTARVRLEVSAEEAPTGEDPPTFLRRLQDLTVKVGTRTRFLVEIVSSTECKVTWYRNERRLMEAERVSLARDGNFWCADVAAVSVDDAGRWTCTAENAGGRASCSAHLNVLVPKAYKRPEFVEELRALLTEQGTVSLECKVVGVPTPVLRWFKDSREIKAGDVFALTANAEDPTSLGTYTCEAVNCMGRAYSSSKVHVVGRATREGSDKPSPSVTPDPPPIFTKELEDQFVRICEPLTLSCHIVVPPWPRSVVWYNKEGKIEPSDRYHVVEDGVGGYLLEIPSAEWPDEGEWKCVASSSGGRVGISSCYVTMDLPKNYRKPRFMENLQAVLTEEGLVSFECKVVGFPTPVLSWFKDGQELKPGDVYQLTGTNSLGSYCCIARNCMGQASSSAELTVEDIQNQLNEEEKLQLFSKNQAPKFLQGLKSVEAKIDEPFRFTIKVAIPPEPSVLWYRDDQPVDESSRCHLNKEERGIFYLDIQSLELLDQAEWKCVAMNDFGHSVTSCFLKLIIPRHYKKPRFLENLQAILSDEGAVNLECKVIGVPQPVLKWYKDGEELKPGDIHRIISGQDGTCCLGTYTCEAQNCMGIAASSASLLGFDDSMKVKSKKKPEEQALQRNLSLSTIHEERTSQMYDTPVGDITLDDRGEISFSFDGKEVSVSLYETPDLTEEEALQIVEMYADQLSENVTEHNVVELPPLRFVKETSTSGNLLMEAIIIDVSPEYFASPEEDLRTEADIEDISIADENGAPQLSLEQDVGGEDYLEKTMALLSDEKADVPKKIARKKSDSLRSGDDYFSLSRDHSLSEGKKDDDTQVLSESDLQSFASARSLGKAKSKSSKPSVEDGLESSDVTRTILLKDESLQKIESDTPVLKSKFDRRSSRSSRRSSSGSEHSVSKSKEDPIEIQIGVEKLSKDVLLSDEEFQIHIINVSASLAKVINDIQIIERDIILQSELMSSTTTASRSLEIISSLIRPLTEIQSVFDAVKDTASVTKDVSSTLFKNLPKSLKYLHQSLTIIEKCIDMESDNKTLVKKTCVAFMGNCGDEMKKWMNEITSIIKTEYLSTDQKALTEINSFLNEIISVIKLSTDTIKTRSLLSEASEIKIEETSLELKHLRNTQKAVFEVKSPLNSLLNIVNNAVSGKITDVNNVKGSEIILNDMSASIQNLQVGLEQIESLSVVESTMSLNKYNTEIIETVMESVLKLRSSFERLSLDTKNEENQTLLRQTLISIQNNLKEVATHVEKIENNIGSFDILQSDHKLEVLQKVAQILISLEANIPQLEKLPCIKVNIDIFHKNLTKVLENVIESNESHKYFTLIEICDAVNRLTTSIQNISNNNILSLASMSNTLKIVYNTFIQNIFESELNCSILSNISETLLSLQEELNNAEEISLQMESEHTQDILEAIVEVNKANVIIEHIDHTIAIIDTVKAIESTKTLKINITPVLENICPVLEDLKRNIASVKSLENTKDEEVFVMSDSSLIKDLATPILELNQNIITLNQVIVESLKDIKENAEVLSAIAEPLHELHVTLEIIQQDIVSQCGDDVSPYEITSVIVSAVQNVQSCIVLIQEQRGIEGVDDMSTLEDISGIKTTAEIIPLDYLLLPDAEEVEVQDAFEPMIQESLTSATAQALQTLNNHIVILQTQEVLEALDTLSDVSDYSSLKSIALGLGELYSGIEEILHPVILESSNEIGNLVNTSKLIVIAEPMQELHKSLSVLDLNNIPVYENILEMPKDKIQNLIQSILEFKNYLGNCIQAVFPAMEMADKTIEISNKVEALRDVCEHLKDIIHTTKSISFESPIVLEIMKTIDNLLEATDVSKGIRINQVKAITEELYEKVIMVQEDLIQFIPYTPDKLHHVAKFIQAIDDIENNIAVLEQYDFVDLSRISELTSCITPQLAIEIESGSLMQMEDVLKNTVNIVQDSATDSSIADLMILEDFYGTCKNEFTVLRHIITKPLCHKKLIRLVQEFTYLQTIINDFKIKRYELRLSQDVDSYLTTFLLQADDNLKLMQSSLVNVLKSQSELLFDTPTAKIETAQEILKEAIEKKNVGCLEGLVFKYLNIIDVAKPVFLDIFDYVIKEMIDPTIEFSREDSVLLRNMEDIFKVVEDLCASTSLDEEHLKVVTKFLYCLQKHQNYKDATGTGKYLIILKCLSECGEILQIITAPNLKIKRAQDTALKTVLYEMLEPLQILRTQLINIQEHISSGVEQNSISLDISSTESIIDTVSGIHKEIIQKIELGHSEIDKEEIALITAANKEIHTIQDSIKTMDNIPVVQELIQMTKSFEDIDTSLNALLTKEADEIVTDEKRLKDENNEVKVENSPALEIALSEKLLEGKEDKLMAEGKVNESSAKLESTSAIKDNLKRCIEEFISEKIFGLIDELYPVITTEELKESVNIAKILRENITTLESIALQETALDLVLEKQVQLTQQLQAALFIAQEQLYKNSQDLAVDLKEKVQQVVDATLNLQSSLTSIVTSSSEIRELKGNQAENLDSVLKAEECLEDNYEGGGDLPNRKTTNDDLENKAIFTKIEDSNLLEEGTQIQNTLIDTPQAVKVSEVDKFSRSNSPDLISSDHLESVSLKTLECTSMVEETLNLDQECLPTIEELKPITLENNYISNNTPLETDKATERIDQRSTLELIENKPSDKALQEKIAPVISEKILEKQICNEPNDISMKVISKEADSSFDVTKTDTDGTVVVDTISVLTGEGNRICEKTPEILSLENIVIQCREPLLNITVCKNNEDIKINNLNCIVEHGEINSNIVSNVENIFNENNEILIPESGNLPSCNLLKIDNASISNPQCESSIIVYDINENVEKINSLAVLKTESKFLVTASIDQTLTTLTTDVLVDAEIDSLFSPQQSDIFLTTREAEIKGSTVNLIDQEKISSPFLQEESNQSFTEELEYNNNGNIPKESIKESIKITLKNNVEKTELQEDKANVAFVIGKNESLLDDSIELNESLVTAVQLNEIFDLALDHINLDQHLFEGSEEYISNNDSIKTFVDVTEDVVENAGDENQRRHIKNNEQKTLNLKCKVPSVEQNEGENIEEIETISGNENVTIQPSIDKIERNNDAILVKELVLSESIISVSDIDDSILSLEEEKVLPAFVENSIEVKNPIIIGHEILSLTEKTCDIAVPLNNEIENKIDNNFTSLKVNEVDKTELNLISEEFPDNILETMEEFVVTPANVGSVIGYENESEDQISHEPKQAVYEDYHMENIKEPSQPLENLCTLNLESDIGVNESSESTLYLDTLNKYTTQETINISDPLLINFTKANVSETFISDQNQQVMHKEIIPAFVTDPSDTTTSLTTTQTQIINDATTFVDQNQNFSHVPGTKITQSLELDTKELLLESKDQNVPTVIIEACKEAIKVITAAIFEQPTVTRILPTTDLNESNQIGNSEKINIQEINPIEISAEENFKDKVSKEAILRTIDNLDCEFSTEKNVPSFESNEVVGVGEITVNEYPQKVGSDMKQNVFITTVAEESKVEAAVPVSISDLSDLVIADMIAPNTQINLASKNGSSCELITQEERIIDDYCITNEDKDSKKPNNNEHSSEIKFQFVTQISDALNEPAEREINTNNIRQIMDAIKSSDEKVIADTELNEAIPFEIRDEYTENTIRTLQPFSDIQLTQINTIDTVHETSDIPLNSNDALIISESMIDNVTITSIIAQSTPEPVPVNENPRAAESIDAVVESSKEESMKQLENLVQEVSEKVDMSFSQRSTEDTEALRDSLDEVQTIIIKLKRDFDGAANDTLNETLEDLECSVRSVQLQINEDSPPNLLKEACATLQLLVNNMSDTHDARVVDTVFKDFKSENVLETCSKETENTVELLEIASNIDTIAASSNLSDIVSNLNNLRNTMMALKTGFTGNSFNLIEKGIEIVQNLDQIEEKVFSIEKDIGSETSLPLNIKDNIMIAVHSVYGSISNMRCTISSIQKQFMFENYGKPCENFLQSIKHVNALYNRSDEELNKARLKKFSKSLRNALNHFEDIKFYINLDKTARLPSDAAFTKIILKELKNNIESLPVSGDAELQKKISNIIRCLENHLNHIEERDTIEVKEKIPLLKDISLNIIDLTISFKLKSDQILPLEEQKNFLLHDKDINQTIQETPNNPEMQSQTIEQKSVKALISNQFDEDTAKTEESKKIKQDDVSRSSINSALSIDFDSNAIEEGQNEIVNKEFLMSANQVNDQLQVHKDDHEPKEIVSEELVVVEADYSEIKPLDFMNETVSKANNDFESETLREKEGNQPETCKESEVLLISEEKFKCENFLEEEQGKMGTNIILNEAKANMELKPTLEGKEDKSSFESIEDSQTSKPTTSENQIYDQNKNEPNLELNRKLYPEIKTEEVVTDIINNEELRSFEEIKSKETDKEQLMIQNNIASNENDQKPDKKIQEQPEESCLKNEHHKLEDTVLQEQMNKEGEEAKEEDPQKVVTKQDTIQINEQKTIEQVTQSMMGLQKVEQEMGELIEMEKPQLESKGEEKRELSTKLEEETQKMDFSNTQEQEENQEKMNSIKLQNDDHETEKTSDRCECEHEVKEENLEHKQDYKPQMKNIEIANEQPKDGENVQEREENVQRETQQKENEDKLYKEIEEKKEIKDEKVLEKYEVKSEIELELKNSQEEYKANAENFLKTRDNVEKVSKHNEENFQNENIVESENAEKEKNDKEDTEPKWNEKNDGKENYLDEIQREEKKSNEKTLPIEKSDKGPSENEKKEHKLKEDILQNVITIMDPKEDIKVEQESAEIEQILKSEQECKDDTDKKNSEVEDILHKKIDEKEKKEAKARLQSEQKSEEDKTQHQEETLLKTEERKEDVEKGNLQKGKTKNEQEENLNQERTEGIILKAEKEQKEKVGRDDTESKNELKIQHIEKDLNEKQLKLDEETLEIDKTEREQIIKKQDVQREQELKLEEENLQKEKSHKEENVIEFEQDKKEKAKKEQTELEDMLRKQKNHKENDLQIEEGNDKTDREQKQKEENIQNENIEEILSVEKNKQQKADIKQNEVEDMLRNEITENGQRKKDLKIEEEKLQKHQTVKEEIEKEMQTKRAEKGAEQEQKENFTKEQRENDLKLEEEILQKEKTERENREKEEKIQKEKAEKECKEEKMKLEEDISQKNKTEREEKLQKNKIEQAEQIFIAEKDKEEKADRGHEKYVDMSQNQIAVKKQTEKDLKLEAEKLQNVETESEIREREEIMQKEKDEKEQKEKNLKLEENLENDTIEKQQKETDEINRKEKTEKLQAEAVKDQKEMDLKIEEENLQKYNIEREQNERDEKLEREKEENSQILKTEPEHNENADMLKKEKAGKEHKEMELKFEEGKIEKEQILKANNDKRKDADQGQLENENMLQKQIHLKEMKEKELKIEQEKLAKDKTEREIIEKVEMVDKREEADKGPLESEDMLQKQIAGKVLKEKELTLEEEKLEKDKTVREIKEKVELVDKQDADKKQLESEDMLQKQTALKELSETELKLEEEKLTKDKTEMEIKEKVEMVDTQEEVDKGQLESEDMLQNQIAVKELKEKVLKLEEEKLEKDKTEREIVLDDKREGADKGQLESEEENDQLLRTEQEHKVKDSRDQTDNKDLLQKEKVEKEQRKMEYKCEEEKIQKGKTEREQEEKEKKVTRDNIEKEQTLKAEKDKKEITDIGQEENEDMLQKQIAGKVLKEKELTLEEEKLEKDKTVREIKEKVELVDKQDADKKQLESEDMLQKQTALKELSETELKLEEEKLTKDKTEMEIKEKVEMVDTQEEVDKGQLESEDMLQNQIAVKELKEKVLKLKEEKLEKDKTEREIVLDDKREGADKGQLESEEENDQLLRTEQEHKVKDSRDQTDNKDHLQKEKVEKEQRKMEYKCEEEKIQKGKTEREQEEKEKKVTRDNIEKEQTLKAEKDKKEITDIGQEENEEILQKQRTVIEQREKELKLEKVNLEKDKAGEEKREKEDMLQREKDEKERREKQLKLEEEKLLNDKTEIEQKEQETKVRRQKDKGDKDQRENDDMLLKEKSEKLQKEKVLKLDDEKLQKDKTEMEKEEKIEVEQILKAEMDKKEKSDKEQIEKELILEKEKLQKDKTEREQKEEQKVQISLEAEKEQILKAEQERKEKADIEQTKRYEKLQKDKSEIEQTEMDIEHKEKQEKEAIMQSKKQQNEKEQQEKDLEEKRRQEMEKELKERQLEFKKSDKEKRDKELKLSEEKLQRKTTEEKLQVKEEPVQTEITRKDQIFKDKKERADEDNNQNGVKIKEEKSQKDKKVKDRRGKEGKEQRGKQYIEEEQKKQDKEEEVEKEKKQVEKVGTVCEEDEQKEKGETFINPETNKKQRLSVEKEKSMKNEQELKEKTYLEQKVNEKKDQNLKVAKLQEAEHPEMKKKEKKQSESNVNLQKEKSYKEEREIPEKAEKEQQLKEEYRERIQEMYKQDIQISSKQFLDSSTSTHYIKEYHYEPTSRRSELESKDKPLFIDHNHRDYTMEFARPSSYRDRSFDSEILASERGKICRRTPLYKAGTLLMDAQLRSSVPPQHEIRSSDQIERRSEIRHKSKALSEARSTYSEKRASVPRDIKRKPVFSTYLTDRTAVESSRVKLTCSVLSSTDPKVTWYKNGVILDNKMKYKTKFIDGLITLEVLNAVPSDSAEYSCTVENENGLVSTSANLKVYPSFEASPIPPTFTRSIRDTYHLAENELVLECRIRGQPLPTITWLKDDKPVSSIERYQAYYLADGVCRLAISHPTTEDSGKYTCKAENSVWSDQITHIVNFTGRESRLSPNLTTIEKSRSNRQALESRRPHFGNVLTDYKVTRGGTIGLQVEIKGSPTSVEWLREGRSVTEAYTNARTFVEHGLYTLALSDVTEKETGLYTCRAFSTHGAVDMNAAITVVHPNELEGKPAIIIGRPEKDILISIGEDLNVSFRVQGEPKPKVVFMKGIRDITNSQRVCKMTSDDYVKFTVKRSVISDAGTYCILARNAYGCDRAFVTVVVRQRASSENLISDWTYPKDDSALSIAERNYRSVPERIPSEPSVVDGGNNWVSLAWPKPDPSVTAPVLAYKVESWLVGKEGGARWVELGITPLNSFDAFNLKQGEEYHFRVTPRNRYGWGESVQTITPIGVGLGGDRPEFVDILPGQLKVLIGETANLCCSVKGKPTPEVIWMKNGHEIEDEDRRVKGSFNGYNCSLTLNGIRIEDEARYSCEASNPHGRASTYVRLAVVTDRLVWEADTKLKRERSADIDGEYPPQFTMRLRDRRVQATYPVRLTCQVVGNSPPTITWFKDGEQIIFDKRHTKSQDEHFHTLEIAPTSLEDGGVYEVMARNSCGAVSCRCNLVVDKGIRAYVAPEFCCGLEPLYRLIEGDELRISAVVEAYPSVGVTWYRDGVRLRPSRRAIMTLDRDGQIELALASVTPRDSGVYTCTASNEVGKATTSGKVDIIGDDNGVEKKMTPPVLISPDVPYSKEPMFVRKPRSSEAYEGDTVIIQCEVVGDPKPDVYWLRDFLKPDYYRDATHFKRIGDGPEYRFEIPHAKLDYTGAYSVVARNVYGEAKAIISLQIFAKDLSSSDEHNIRYGRVDVIPRFERELTDLLCHDGDAIEFECRVSGNPEPDIKWFHYNELIRECPDFEWSFDEGAARLKIKQVTAEDEGTYMCEASNTLGKTTSNACLVVYPPGEPNTLSQRLRRPPALLSAASTPRSTPRTTPARSVSRTPGPDARRLCSPSRQMAPKFYTYPFNKVVEEGDHVTFQCAVKGLPAPWATWDKDGIIITPSSRITIKEKDEILRILEIEEVTIEDVGLYRITVENDYGRVEASARLEVITQQGKFYAGVRSYSASPRKTHPYRRRLSSSRQD